MRTFMSAVCVLTLVVPLMAQSEREGNADAARLVGTWRLVSRTVNGGNHPQRGANPVGLIIYDASGNMAVQIMADPALRTAYPGYDPTPEEAKAALQTYAAYFGTYTVDERARLLHHHPRGNIHPGQIRSSTRRYEFLSADRLQFGDSGNGFIWERAR